MAFHERLCEGLAGLETRGVGRRSEQQPSGAGESIGDAETERKFGTDNGEVNRFANRKREERVDIRHIDVDGLRDSSDSGVARSTNHRFGFTLSFEPGHDRVLSRTAADNENSHYVNELGRATGLLAQPWVRGTISLTLTRNAA